MNEMQIVAIWKQAKEGHLMNKFIEKKIKIKEHFARKETLWTENNKSLKKWMNLNIFFLFCATSEFLKHENNG